MAKEISKKVKSYRDFSEELDDFVAKLQDPEVAVDDATKYYEAAMELITQLEDLLEKAENQIRQIRAKYSENS